MDDNMFNDLLASGGSPGGASAPQPGPQGGPAQGTPPAPTGGAPTQPDASNNGPGTSGADTDIKLLHQHYVNLLIQRGVPAALMLRTIQRTSSAVRRDGEGARPMLERRIRNLEQDFRGGFEPGGFGMQSAHFPYGPPGGNGGFYGGFEYYGGFGGYGF